MKMPSELRDSFNDWFDHLLYQARDSCFTRDILRANRQPLFVSFCKAENGQELEFQDLDEEFIL